MNNNSFLDKFSSVAMRLGSQIHLSSLRDAFAIIMPFFILAGIATLINSVIFPALLSGAALEQAQIWGRLVSNGTLNISGLLVAPMIAYCLSKNRGFENRISAAAVAIASLIIVMPLAFSLVPTGGSETVLISGAVGFNQLGTRGVFAGIIVGLLATEVYIALSKVGFLKINLGEDVPPAVGRSFSMLLPVMLVIALFAFIGTFLNVFFNTDLIALISMLIQEPLRKVNTSLPGVLILFSLANLLFTLGIHQTVITSTLLSPFLLVNMNENMLAFEAGAAIPHILNVAFVPTFGMIGGSGSTICLIIATILFSRNRASKDISRLAAAPGAFNINEPVIFGYPIVFNLPLIIPFVLVPVWGIAFAYLMTVLGFMREVVVMIPWTTPPLINAFLSTAGDWRAVIVQIVIIIGGVLIYLPFMKISDRIAQKESVKTKNY